MARFCENCGGSVSESAKFCSSCGQRQAQASPVEPQYQQAYASPPVLMKAKKPIYKRWWFWLIAFFFLPAGLIILFIDLSKQAKHHHPQYASTVPATAPITNFVRDKGNGAYVRWFLFYFFFFTFFTAGIAVPVYIITVMIAFSKTAEKLWRKVSGVRPLRLKSEKSRLLPLFKEVYTGAFEADPNLSKGIKLYIKEDMNINAFAFGRETLVLTRGSLELLNDDCLKGFIAHEFGHFSHGDTKAILLATVSNYFMSKTIVRLTDRVNRYEAENRSGFIAWIVKGIYRLFKAIDFIGEAILQRTSRRNEYYADSFALKSGFGEDLAKVLNEIYSISGSKPQSVKEQFKSTHPDITLRIERLEMALDDVA